jgi:O-antigen/teichoic acid export membrane protein
LSLFSNNYKKLLVIIASLATPFFSLLFLPIVSSKLTIVEYGIISSFTLFIAYVSSIHGFCSATYFSREYYKTEKISSLLSNVFFVYLLSLVIIISVVFVTKSHIVKLFPISYIYIYLGLAICFIESFISLNLLYLRLCDDLILFSIITIMKPLLFTSSYILLLKNEYGLNSFFISSIFVSIVMMIFSLFIFNRKKILCFCFDGKQITKMLKYGFGLLPHSIFGVLSISIDKLFVLKILSTSSLGIYSLAFSIASVVKLVEGSVYLIYQPWLFKNLSSKNVDRPQIIRISLTLILSLLLFTILYCYLIILIFPLFVDEKFNDSLSLIPYFAIGFFINGIYTVCNQFLLFDNKTTIISLITVLTVLIGSIFSYFFTIKLGLYGAVYAFIMVFILRTVLTLISTFKLSLLQKHLIEKS